MSIRGAAQTGASTGPGRGLQLSPSNRHAPNRLLFIGHRGAYQQDFIWFSDDGGKSYALSKTPTGNSLPKMDEAQLVENSDGTIIANMRWEGTPTSGRGVATSTDSGPCNCLPPTATASDGLCLRGRRHVLQDQLRPAAQGAGLPGDGLAQPTERRRVLLRP